MRLCVHGSVAFNQTSAPIVDKRQLVFWVKTLWRIQIGSVRSRLPIEKSAMPDSSLRPKLPVSARKSRFRVTNMDLIADCRFGIYPNLDRVGFFRVCFGISVSKYMLQPKYEPARSVRIAKTGLEHMLQIANTLA